MGNFGNFVTSNSGAIASVASTLLTNGANARQNRLNRKWTEKMAEKERTQFLEDREHTESREDQKQAYEEWYNSPAHQRELLNQANMGLGTFDSNSDISLSPSNSGTSGSLPTSYQQTPFDFNLGANAVELFDSLTRDLKQASINKTNAETAKTKSDMTISEKQEIRAEELHAHDKDKWDFELQKMDQEIRGLKLSNQEKVQAMDHNRLMNLYQEKASAIELDIKSKTRNDVIRLSHQNVELNDAKLKAMAQDYIINGPQAYYSKVMSEFYGNNAPYVTEKIQNEFNCDAITAQIKAVDLSLEQDYINSSAHHNAVTVYNNGIRTGKEMFGGPSMKPDNSASLLLKGLKLLK